MITVSICHESPESLPETATALGLTCFARLYREAHGEDAEVPAEVACDPLWAGPDSAEAHEALLDALEDEARTLESIYDEGYVKIAAGDSCDAWVRFRVVEA